MSEAWIVLCTCGSRDEADSIASTLVNERLAACVNILPPVQSVYRWQGAVERADEILLVIKTTAARFSALRDRIQAIHSYDTPEIIAIEAAAGSERYLTWLGEQCSEEVH
jgi:periplasmic divalent cation tolerance protein